ncbi:ABC transporter permease [Thermus filiformis]|uniref:ABC transporter permease n=1 Tax=Thermus filiformis TaxID=276 RepID=A0A0A2WV71_THEFI|nr:FtsX-like permease family protein [Thermus filiformis]KGQ22175.1 ABC transporter permease [Thermus filiformis]
MRALAWRNLWRASGRSLTTLAIVALVVALSVVFLSVYRGAMEALLQTFTERSGHLIVRVKGFLEKQDLMERTFPEVAPRLEGARLERVLEGSALLIAKERSRPVLLTGLEEEGLKRQARHLRAGRLPRREDEAALGLALARALRVDLGDEVVAYAPGGTGRGVAAFRVVGLLDLPETALEARTALVLLPALQDLLAPGRLSRLEFRLENPSEEALQRAKAQLQKALPGLEVLTWGEAYPVLEVVFRLYTPIMAVFVGFFFVLAGLILLNTLYLSLSERVREFGLLSALGMGQAQVVALVLWESLLLVGAGTLLGLLLGSLAHLRLAQGYSLPFGLAEQYMEFGLPQVLYGRLAPWDLAIVLGYAVGVSVLAALWPAYLAGRLEPVRAMRYVP